MCNVQYCSTCVVGDPSKCSTCRTTFSLTGSSTCQCAAGKRLYNGYCQSCSSSCSACITSGNGNEYCNSCSGDLVLHNGNCVSCSLVGCNKCQNITHCQTCTDSSNTNIVGGNCSCSATYEKLNPTGYCERCQILGCSSCNSGPCVACQDSMANVVNGKC